MNEQQKVRREALQKLRSLGINPYPSESFEVNTSTKDIRNHYAQNPDNEKNATLAGRIMSRRIMGNASFAELQDAFGRIQLYLRQDDICPEADKTMYKTVFKKLLDIGDIIGVTGVVFTTKMGEISLRVRTLKLLSKSLRPLPIVKKTGSETEDDIIQHDAFVDPEQRYRMRYVDLIVNPEVRTKFIQRTQMTNALRSFLNQKGYLEVETPILQPLYGGASARPFTTYHHTLDTTLYLRISNELYLKRLIVGGFDGVYEFSKDFRNEGISRFHNPEFTQVELYVVYKDYQWMMSLVEEMIEKVVLHIHGTTTIEVGGKTINFKRPWKRYTMYEAIMHFTGVDITDMDEKALHQLCKEWRMPQNNNVGKGKLIDEIFGEKCEPLLIQPTHITNLPITTSPLAKKHRDNPQLAERFESICNGKELCNAFSELNDPLDQRQRFEEQLELMEKGDKEAMALDEDYLRALEHGMPPTAGLGLGIDRLAMIITNSSSIRDVIFFPQMRPKHQEKNKE